MKSTASYNFLLNIYIVLHRMNQKSLIASLLIFPLVISSQGLAASNPDWIFEIKEGLFDHTKPETLGLPLVKSEMSVPYKATDDNWTCNTDPSITVFKNRLYAMWSNSKKDENGAGQRVIYTTSFDGLHWSEPKVLISPDMVPPSDISFVYASAWGVIGDKLYAYANNRRQYFRMESSDGERWSSPGVVLDIGKGAAGFSESPHPVGPNYLLLGQDAARNLRILYSTTPLDSKSWQPAAISGIDLGQGEWREPSIFSRPDGAVVARIRASRKQTQNNTMYAAESLDQGKTWRAGLTNFPDAIAKTSTGNLPDGRAYIVNNPGRPRDRRVLAISLSKDGRLFDKAFAIGINPPPVKYPGKYKGADLPGYQGPGSCVWKDHLYVISTASKDDVVVFRIPLTDLN